MSIDEAVSFIKFALEKDMDEILFQRWIPLQGEMSFDEFKNKITEVPKTDEEILSDVEIILEQFARSKK